MTDIEHHPLQPFLPPKARILMLGSFPPPSKRWCMNFFYPNFLNDMWRIFGLVYFKNRDYFVDAHAKRFNQSLLEEFLSQKGVALFDTAVSVRRLKENASDHFLEIVEPTDIPALLERIPSCRAIVATGQKAIDTLRLSFAVEEPKIGQSVAISHKGRELRLYRMPSTSRAYPLKLEKKGEAYASMLRAEGLL